jgi:hypothetical protein
MTKKIIFKKSSVVGKIPTTSDLDVGEIAINLADKAIYTKDVSENIIKLTKDLIDPDQDAPDDGGLYLRKNGGWAQVEWELDEEGNFLLHII